MYAVTTSSTVCAIAGDADDGTADGGGLGGTRNGPDPLRDELLPHLAGRRPRQLVQEMHAVRDLEIRQQLPTALLHPGRRRLLAGTNDGNLDDLAEHVVRHGEGRAFLDAFHAVDDLLDLPGKNILPADIDHVLAPADDVDVAPASSRKPSSPLR